MNNSDLLKLFISRQSSIKEALLCIDNNVRGIAIVVDEDHKLEGTITDGDIRRTGNAFWV